MAAGYVPPGRLGDPAKTLQTDPRTNPDLLKLLESFSFAGSAETHSTASTLEEIKPLMANAHAQFSGLYEVLPNDLTGDEDEPRVEHKTITVDGKDGHKIPVHIFRKADHPSDKPLPAVIYTHGGGMTILDTINKVHVRWLQSLALAGVVAITVDYRNAWTEAKHNPFPTGLNDCAAAAQYLASHRTELGMGKIVLQGESGGANLAIATAMRANSEGWVKEIAGIYACVPYVSGGYGWSQERKLKELPSLVECEGYVLDVSMMAGMAHYYTPTDADKTNPMAWPYHAAEKDLKGFPPTVLSMDELDPLRDEGMALYRKMVAAGVDATAEVNLGVTHGASLTFRKVLPELYKKVISNIAAFANRL